jgi:hypothetical protein
MDRLDVISLAILFLIILMGVGIVLVLGWLPGSVSQKRHSPWAEAINVAGWLGLLFPPIWMGALICAFIRPRTGEGASIALTESETRELAESVAAVARRMAELENGMRVLGRDTGGPR